MDSASSSTSSGAPQVAVAVRGDGRGSRRAARWAAASLVPGAGRVALVHVIPPLAFVPTPSGEQVPVEKMERDTVEMYAEDRRARALEVFLPFRRLCGRKPVESVVLEGDSVAEALVRYAAESGVRSLVLGSCSLGWFRRMLRLRDVPTIVLKTMPSSCNVYVVSRRKLTIKFAMQARTSKLNPFRIQSISHKAFIQKQRDWFQDKQSLHNLADDETPNYSGNTSLNSCSQAHSSLSTPANAVKSSESPGRGLLGSLSRKILGGDGKKDFGVIGQLKNTPYVTLSSVEECQPIDEVAKMRKELKDTLMVHDRACENIIHANKKMQLLSTGCCEDVKRVQGTLQREEVLNPSVANEETKHVEPGAVDKANNSLTREAYSKQKAETVANLLSTEKAKIGEGGYGNVYKCTLDHTEVAVKVIQQDSSDKIDEFLREVEILSQLQHPNLVLLLGFCPEIGCLVYEYMENGSLEDHLSSTKRCQPLHWFLRFQIIFEVACGLAFLHGTKPEPIVHRDLKPGNILLDKNYVSKIGDIGLAKLISDLVPEWLTEYNDTVIAGTLFYMDPEYQLTGTIRPKSDLYALGIIILQLLTGKRPLGLILSVEEAIKKGTLSDILDKSQTDWPIAEAEILANLGLRCTALKCRDRPNLDSELLPELENILSKVTASLKQKGSSLLTPRHFICPILQEVMEDPYVAADGHTYEQRAIKAWLRKYNISPVTKQKLPNLSIIPNHSLHAAIQQWKSRIS
ncbi:hypothetical protein QOZ80_6AG0543530 [Eleusine coracana subsp. coracana]|nr:hypothetical protein QOZ80_6AG0543530 [Eleusine coracana subsp. coracana]